MENELLLNIPFSDPAGSSVAQDYAPGENNAALLGGQFIRGRLSRAVRFAEEGRAEIIGPVIPLEEDFTLSVWVLAHEYLDTPTDSWLLLKFSGQDRFVPLLLGTPLTSWSYLTLIQQGRLMRVYVNSDEVAAEVYPDEWGMPTGFCLLNDNPSNQGGFSAFEDLTVYRGVVPTLIETPVQFMELNYYINGRNFKDFGVYVSESSGIIDNLKMKDPKTVDWDDYHGEAVDLSRPRYLPRDITLSCFVEGVGKDAFLDRVRDLVSELTKPGTQRLMLSVHSTKPLVYEVYCKETINLRKKWSDSMMVGTFELQLREPQPVKRVLRFSGPGTASITLSSNKSLTVYWGDGTRINDVYGSGVTLTHTYASAGEYLIIVAGVIEEITAFTTNAEVVWNKL